MSLLCGEDLDSSPSPQRPLCSLEAMQPASPSPPDQLPAQLDELHLQQLAATLKTEQRQWRGQYLHLQPELASEHRFYLVQWLHAACYQCHLPLSAFAIGVTLLDRLLAEVPVHICQSRLVTIACLSIAAKLDGPEAVHDVSKFQVRTELWQTAYTAREIGDMELDVAEHLDWACHCATIADFLDRLLAVAGVGRDRAGALLPDGTADAVRIKAQHLAFQSLLDGGGFLGLKPSSTAAAAILGGMAGRCSDQQRRHVFALFSCHLDQVQIVTAMELFTNNVGALGEQSTAAQESQQEAPVRPSPPAIKLLQAMHSGGGCASPSLNNLADKLGPPWASPHSISPTSVIIAAEQRS